MDCFTYRLITAERERNVRNTARDHGIWQVLLDPPSSLNKVHTIVVVFFNTCRYRKDIRVKNNIFRRKANFIDQHIIRSFTDFFLALNRIGLTFFIKSHNNDSRTILTA